MSSSSDFAKDDATLAADADFKKLRERFSKAASAASLEKVTAGLKAKNHSVEVVADAAAALEAAKAYVPSGSTIYNSGSTTFAEIGLLELIKTGIWDNLHGKALVASGGDQSKLLPLLRGALKDAEFAFTTVDAVTENGEFYAVDASGTRVAVHHNAGKHVIIIGSNKIVADDASAEDRIQYCYKLESARVRKAYGWPASKIATKSVINDGSFLGGRYHFIIIKGAFGF